MAAWREAAETTQPRRKKKGRRFPLFAAHETMQPTTCHRPNELTRGQLYNYHRQNGTLGLFWAMFGMPEPVA
jgi:hypothetical protein